MTRDLGWARDNAAATGAAFAALANRLASRAELAPLAERARRRSGELAQDKFTVMVVGEFKRGKSTLLNAMLGQNVLPAKTTPCTAIVTYIRHGTTPEVEVHFNDGRPLEHLSPADFAKRYELKVADTRLDSEAVREEVQDRFSTVDYAVFRAPSTLCADGVEFVDTPGLREHDARTRRVLENLATADAIIMVLDAQTGLNMDERDFIDLKLKPLGLHRHVFFVVNRWNLLLESLVDPSDEEAVRRMQEEHLQFIGERLLPFAALAGGDVAAKRIFKVNALGALRLRLKGQRGADLEATEVPAFERALAEFLVNDRHAARHEKDRAIVEGIEGEASALFKGLVARARAPLAGMEEERRRLDANLGQFRRIKVNIESLIQAQAAEAGRELAGSLEGYLKEELYGEGKLAAKVGELDLGDLEHITTQYRLLGDLWRSHEAKLSTRIASQLQHAVGQMITRCLTSWREAWLEPILRARTADLERLLKQEAGEYVRVMAEIRGGGGGRVPTEDEITAKIRQWIGEYSVSLPQATQGATVHLASLAASIGGEVILHSTSGLLLPKILLPGVGIAVSLVIAVLRHQQTRDKVRAAIVQALKDKERELLLDQQARMSEAVNAAFGKIAGPISSSIEGEIAVISASMTDLIARRHDASFSADAFALEIADFAAGVHADCEAVRRLAS